MAKISLRGYNREIENLINSGRTDEAIAHCKFVLKFFPKCIDTYRLMGKAYLEAQRYGEAADILSRVLSVIPDDFVSQIGMSIIREDEGNLDAAIFHMERAFEVKPSNSAIQEELRRLYGRRDGIEPPRVRLTRGALVRMYTRGELYPQAIAEIHAALSEDQKHVDLEIILAQIYLKLGRKVEATEICSRLVNKLPYCYEANHILAEILPGTSRAQDADVYRQRVIALDPYAQFIGDTITTSTDAPDNLVTLDFLDYQSSQQTMSQQPDWARAVGVELQPLDQPMPDWLTLPISADLAEEKVKAAPQSPLTDAEPPKQVSGPTIESETTLEVSPPDQDEVIPDWMKSAGWSPSSGLSKENQASFSAEGDGSGELEQADIPEWLKAMAPSEEVLETPVEGEQENLAMLDQLLSKQGTPAEPAVSPPYVPEEDTGNIPVIPVKAFINAGSLKLPKDEETPSWLAGIAMSSAENQKVEPFNSEELPAWMEEGEKTEPQTEFQVPEPVASEGTQSWTGETQVSSSTEPQQAVPSTSDELPDWLSEVTSPASPETELPASISGEKTPAWLSEVEVPVQTEGQPGTPTSSEEVPDWLSAIGTIGMLDEQPVEPTSAPEMPAWLNAIGPSADIQSQPGDESILQEISSLSEGESLASEEELPQAVAPEEYPAWLAALGVAQNEEEQPAEPASEAVTTWASPQESVEPQEIKPAEDKVPDWMAELRAEENIETPPGESGSAEMPDWIVKLETTAPTESLSTIGAESKSEDSLDHFSKTQPVRVKKVEIPPVEETILAAENTWEEGTEPVDAMMEENILEGEAVPAFEEKPVSEIQPEIVQSIEQTPTIPPAAAVAVVGALQSPEEMDMDSAFAWLESLAVKQGADEGTLLVSPENREETLPAWLQQEVTTEEAAESIAQIPSADLEIAEEIGEMAVPVAEAQNVQPVELEPVEQIYTQLEEPAAPLSVNETILETPSTGAQKPEEEPIPDWMKDLMAPAPGEYMATAEPANPESITAWLKGVDVPPEIAKTMPSQQTPEAEPEALPDWLREIAPKPGMPLENPPAAPEALPEWVQEAKVSETVEPEIVPQEPLPEWLQQIETALPAEDSTVAKQPGEPEAETMPQAEETAPIVFEPAMSTAPEEPSEIPVAILEEEPVVAQIEEAPEAVLAAEEEPVVAQIEGAPEAVLTAEEEPFVAQVEEAPEAVLAAEEEPFVAQVEELKPTIVPEFAAESGINYETIKQEAQTALDQSNLAFALERFNLLIESDQYLDDVIHDLRNAIYRHPVDIPLHISLGDAYAHGNRLQDALDTYTKAEDLLR